LRNLSYLFFAILIVFVGARLDARYAPIAADEIVTTARVVDVLGGSSAGRLPLPVCEYADEHGNLHHLITTDPPRFPRLARGDSVPVAYSRAQPERARIATFWRSHGRALIATVLALLIVVTLWLRSLLAARRRAGLESGSVK